jgi:putative flavoprotein involved in K+ transport
VDATTVIIGAGHAGLAMSRRLTERSIDHVVIERGEVANSWRTERWDSLRLLTPNWMNRLPGQAPSADDPDGFMTMPEVISMLSSYADHIGAPVHTGTTVTRVRRAEGGYTVETDRGTWRCRALVLATGACNVADVPAPAAGVPPAVLQLTPMTYRSPGSLPDGGVLVVGASATGVQLAEEIQRSGRPVTLSVGEHVRLPRRYRGRDIMWWMDAAGVLDERWDEVDDLVRARNLPSPQLIGTPERRTIDLNSLAALGVRLVGRIGRVHDGVAQFSGSLTNTAALADLKLDRLLRRLDEWARSAGVDDGEPERFTPTAVPATPTLEIDLRSGEITTIVWATGYRPDYRWLDVPVLDRRGRIVHHGGVVAGPPGLYVLGTSLLRTRRSNFIDGSGADSASIATTVSAGRSKEHRDGDGRW